MKQYAVLCLLVLFTFQSHAQESSTIPLPDWNGDPKLCTVDPSAPIINDKLPPVFSNQAEFTLERVEVKHIMDVTLPSELTLYQYIYDYDANKLILVKNTNGFIDVEFYYYESLKKSTYYRRTMCAVSDILTNVDIDGTSATQLQNGTWHIRPLNEFLLFSSNDPRRPIIRPRYIGQSLVRGIAVDQWESCIVNKAEFRTFRRVWSFAIKGQVMPAGPVGDIAIPVQAIISASVSLPNGTEVVEFDEIFNVHAYRTGIEESSDQLVPPKGVFCDSGPGQNLISLREAGIGWPDRFSVRVEASSSRSPQWQRFHLRYDRGFNRGSRRIRYDYLPPGSEDFESVIYDFGDNLTYTIDRRVGSCKITNGVGVPDVDPFRNPIGFFIKHEDRFIFRTAPRIWERNGFRSCRANSIKCAIVTSAVDNFPVLIDPDTEQPNGDAWEATSVEYGWSIRAPLARPPPGTQKGFDYPVYLFLRMYRFGADGPQSPSNIRTEDLEYEFYEMSHEMNPYDFDTSICYRSNNYDYLHLGFKLKLRNGDIVDGNHLDRRSLERQVHGALVIAMQIKYSRITDIEVDHESGSNDVNVLFTLLGQTPRPGTASGVADDEPQVSQSQARLRTVIDNESFKFTMTLTDDSDITVQFQSVSGSLKSSKLFMSPHVTGKQVLTDKYSSSAELGAGFGGILVGLLLGVLIAAAVRIVRKEPMPNLPALPTSVSNPLPNISFYNKKTTTETTTPASDA